MKKLYKIFVGLILVCSIACTSGNSDNNPESSISEISLSLSDAVAILRTESTDSSFQKLTADDSLSPIVLTGGSSILHVSYLAVSPTGDLHIVFNYPVTVNDVDCSWIVIRSDNNNIECVDASVTGFSDISERALFKGLTSQAEECCSHTDSGLILAVSDFDASGNATYEVQDAGFTETIIRRWDRTTGVASTLLDGEAIGLNIRRFSLLADGSLILTADLQGSSHNLFRFVPDGSGSGSLQELCVDAENTEEEQFIVSSNGTLYVATSSQVTCTEGEQSGIFQGELVNGELNFIPVESEDSIGFSFWESQFAEDSEGNIYLINDSNDSLKAALISSTPFEEIAFFTVVDAELAEASGDYLFLTGTNSDGNRVFMRKHLLGDREEIDLLGGSNLLVQHFDVAENGDVYFGALDLDTTTVYLYKYDNTTGQLEQLDSLPGDLLDIVLL